MEPTPGCHGSSRGNTDLYDLKSFPDEGSEGRFGRIFPVGEGGKDKHKQEKLRPHPSPRYDLERLGKKDGPLQANEQRDSAAPAGMTFLGQFIDHDITLDTQSKFDKPQINAGLENARTPNLDLDCVYGGGPDASPHLYAGPYLMEGDASQPVDAVDSSDLLRNPSGRAIIGDPRNDENIIVSQVQAAVIRFHNRAVDVLRKKSKVDHKKLSDAELFEKARDNTTHYYHRVVLEDFLYHVIGVDMIHSIATDSRQLYFPHGFWDKKSAPLRPFMPVEFSVAAYRYGHSQVRDSYKINEHTTVELFHPRGSEKTVKNALTGFQTLPDKHRVDWDNYFTLPGQAPKQMAFKIDPFLPAPLLELPTNVVGSGVTSLAARNLLRSRTFRLPAGEDVAQRLADKGALLGHDPEAGKDLIIRIACAKEYEAPIKELLAKLGSDYALTTTPLWLYILIEAAVHGDGFGASSASSGGGDRLGPVGGRIVGEVLMGLLDHYRDMSGKGLDYSPGIEYNFGSTADPDTVQIVETPNFGPRMSMRAFVNFAYGAPLDDINKARGHKAEAEAIA